MTQQFQIKIQWNLVKSSTSEPLNSVLFKRYFGLSEMNYKENIEDGVSKYICFN